MVLRVTASARSLIVTMGKIKSSRSTERSILCNHMFTISSCPSLFEPKITMAGPSRGPTAHARVALYRAANDAARPSPDDAGLGPFGSRSLPRPLVARAPATTRTFNRGGCAELRFKLPASTHAAPMFTAPPRRGFVGDMATVSPHAEPMIAHSILSTLRRPVPSVCTPMPADTVRRVSQATP